MTEYRIVAVLDPTGVTAGSQKVKQDLRGVDTQANSTKRNLQQTFDAPSPGVEALKARLTGLERSVESLSRTTGGLATANRNVAGAIDLTGVALNRTSRAYTNAGATVTSFTRNVAYSTTQMNGLGRGATTAGNAVESGLGAAGKLGLAAGFMGGAFGEIVASTVVGLAALAYKALTTGNEVEEMVRQMREDARQTELTRQAHAIYNETLEAQLVISRQLNDEIERSIRTQSQSQALVLRNAQVEVSRLQVGLVNSRTELLAAMETLRRAQASLATPGPDDDANRLMANVQAAQAEVIRLTTQITTTSAAIEAAQRATARAEQPIISGRVEAALDRRTAATTRYERAVGNLNIQLGIRAGREAQVQMYNDRTGRFDTVTARGISREQYQTELLRLGRERDAAVAAAQAAERAQRSTTRTPQQVFEAFEAALRQRGIVRAAGRTGFRTAADQNEIFRTQPGATPLDGYRRPSPHQAWRALDPTRASATGPDRENAAREAAQAAGLRNFQIIHESGGRIHYQWRGAGRAGEVDLAGPAAEQRREETAAARAARERERAAEAAARRREQEGDFVQQIEDEAAGRGLGNRQNTLQGRIARARADFRRRFNRELTTGEGSEEARVTGALTAADARETAQRFDEAYVQPLQRLQALQEKTKRQIGLFAYQQSR